MKFFYNDAGRARAGFKSKGDCVTRSLALVAGQSYTQTRLDLSMGQMSQGRSHSAGDGVYTLEPWFKAYMAERGFKFVACDSLSSIPSVGKFAVSMHRHYTTIIDGIIVDTFDPRLDKAAKVIHGYWRKA